MLWVRVWPAAVLCDTAGLALLSATTEDEANWILEYIGKWQKNCTNQSADQMFYNP